eukprot:jgi/Picre1/29988/NNA_005364.t1
MSFFQRVANYLVQEVLVDTLANSKVFQRFAVRSNDSLQMSRKKAWSIKKVLLKSHQISLQCSRKRPRGCGMMCSSKANK